MISESLCLYNMFVNTLIYAYKLTNLMFRKFTVHSNKICSHLGIVLYTLNASKSYLTSEGK